MAASQSSTAASSSSDFPPFDTSLFSSQVFWFIIAFGALYIVLSSVIIPRVAKTLAHRRATIDGDLQLAAQETSAAQAARAAAEKAAADAKAQARQTVEDMRVRNEAEAAKAQAAATARATADIEAAEAAITAMRTSAMDSIGSNVAELAGDIVERITGKKPTAKVLDTAMKSYQSMGAA